MFTTLFTNEQFWFAMLSFAILMYVILDGFDLGLGILYPWFRDEQERGLMMSSIAHIWDGNETWLVFGGVILFAAFPAAYALLLSQMYLPVIMMLLALVLRGASFEYRFKATTSTQWWDRIFSFGSAVAAFAQGYILGSVVLWQQPQTINGINLFAILTGLAVMAGYALLACGWMIIKKSTDMQIRAAKLAQKLTVMVMLSFVVVCLWTVLASPAVYQRWFSWPNIALLAPLPMLAVIISVSLYRYCQIIEQSLEHSANNQTNRLNQLNLKLPFALTVGLFMIGFAGLWVGMYPYIIPGQLTLTAALAPVSSLEFTAPGVVILIPVILSYTIYGYRVFGGKAQSIVQVYK
ncbi:MAG: cytochrome d ubiquinol oxidase subunit II [Phenylobacterium sp.]|jgi:cytochrome d ubiquinol oxidase subunit II